MALMLLFLAAAVGSIFVMVSTYGITGYLEDHGIRISYWNMRSKFWSYLRQYREMALESTGRIGRYYYISLASLVYIVLWFVVVLQMTASNISLHRTGDKL